jgi:chemosensory pili system protein ChpE
MADPVILVAAGLGLAYGSAPGAVNAETIRRGVSRGFRPAFLVQVGSLLGDVGWAVLALAGLAVVLRDTTLRATLGVAGALLLLWFAWSALRGAATASGEPESEAQAARARSLGALGTGVLFSVANPFGPVFWLGVGGGLAAGGAVDQTVGGAVAFIGAFTVGALVWAISVSSLLGFARRWATPRLFRVVDVACGLAFGFFGIRLLLDSIGVLRGG